MGVDEERILSRRQFLGTAAASSAALYLTACGSSSSSGGGSKTSGGKVTLNNLFQQQAGYSAEDLAGMTTQFERAYPNIKVNNTLVAYEALHDKIVAAAPAGTYDVVLGDCIWPAEFGSKGIVQDLSGKVQQLPVSQIFPGAIQMAQYQGKYYGMPWILDTKYLYANKKMLAEAGKTTADLTTLTGMVSTLEALKNHNVVRYPFMGSWKQAEAVVCDYATLVGAFGGKFLDESGKAAFNTGGGVQALEFMKSLLDKGLANPSSTTSAEEEVLKAFAAQQVAVNWNWTFQLAGATDPTKSKVAKADVAILHTPKGTAATTPGVNGGQPVMITAGSKHPEEAWEFIKFITSQPVQNGYVKDSLPIWAASYREPQVIKTAGPQLIAVAKTQLPDMILRPQVTNYNAASQELQVQIQRALLGKASAQSALNTAAGAFASA
jgi:multiple sugar transport system substrate-binding protein